MNPKLSIIITLKPRYNEPWYSEQNPAPILRIYQAYSIWYIEQKGSDRLVHYIEVWVYYFNYYLLPAWVNHDGAKKVHFVVEFIISNFQISQSSMDKYRMPGDIQILYNQHNSTS